MDAANLRAAANAARGLSECVAEYCELRSVSGLALVTGSSGPMVRGAGGERRTAHF